MIQRFDDISSPELKAYSALTRRQLSSESIFIAESIPVIESALNAGVEPVSLLCEERHINGKAAPLIEKLGALPVYTAPDEALKQLTGYELSRGVLCAMKRPAALSAEDALKGARNVAVLENVRDETNIGAIFRSAAALGMDAVLYTPGCTDVMSRRAVRVSMGTVFKLPHARIPDLCAGGFKLLSESGFTACALALTDKSVNVTSLPKGKLALILGNEGEGLSDETVQNSAVTLRIPMAHGVDSLNVSSAAAIAFWEAAGRRE